MPVPQDYPDHGRVLALLWRSGEQPSVRSGLTVGRIVDAAVQIADDAGLAGLSMRRIAERLGVGAMSLYTYVASKAELIPVMIDRVLGELPEIGPPGGGWRDQLAAVGHGYWDLYARHQWLLEVPLSRPLPGPNGSDRYEAELRVIDGLGLTELEMGSVLSLIGNHTAGSARRALEIARDVRASGMTDDEWWYSVEPLLIRYLHDRDLPVSARVGSAIGAPHTNPRADFEFGLERILDGLELLITTRNANG